MGTLPAPDLCKKLGIKDQTDRNKLEKAKQDLYLHSFNNGVMLDSSDFIAGKPVVKLEKWSKTN